MENPWIEINKQQKFLSIDKGVVDKHNQRYSEDHYLYLQTDLWPEPFIGDKDAQIYLLLANPARPGKEEEKEFKLNQNNPEIEELILKNLNHTFTEYPFYHLDTKNDKIPGCSWWGGCFRYIRNDVDQKKLSQEFFALEIMGYPSHSLPRNLIHRLPSVEYTKYLVGKAIREDKLVIICRSASNWFDLVPQLEKYDNCHLLAKNRKIELSRNTISPPAWNKIIQILKSA